MSAWASLDMSHARNALGSRSSVLMECVAELPHSLHRHLWLPALILPFLFIGAPHTVHHLDFK